MGTVEIMAGAWRWIAVTAAVVGTAAGLWWALADFIIDRVGSPRTEWGDQLR
jgi:hypothetical protein